MGAIGPPGGHGRAQRPLSRLRTLTRTWCAHGRLPGLCLSRLEDFGLAPVQAMAAGRPVIAYAGGGALDSVVEGVTGTFFHEQTPGAGRRRRRVG
jgi:hypothetical protein